MRYFKHHKTLVSILLIFTLLGFASGPLLEWLGRGQLAQAVGGYIAVNELGQLDANDQPLYTTAGADNMPNRREMATPSAIAIDTVNHRLFVGEFFGFRILVFNLDVSDHLIDHVADFVLGATDFKHIGGDLTASGIGPVTGLTYDDTTNLLYASDYNQSRVLVFDVTTITNSMDAVHVLGQDDTTGPNAGDLNFFNDGSPGTTQSIMNNPAGLTLDKVGQRLFVADANNNRVLVFDVASITNGEPAINVLGQDDTLGPNAGDLDFFNDSTEGTTQSVMDGPFGVRFDSTTSRLFVAERDNNRVLVFDVTAITDGENAINVLGQNDDGTPFNNSVAATTQNGMRLPGDVTLDETGQRLFVSDTDNSRVLVFDLSGGITDGMDAAFELGQNDNNANLDFFDDDLSVASQNGLGHAEPVLYDPTSDYLYVGDGNFYKRVMIWDVSSVTNGMDAIDLLGHVDQDDDPVFTAGGTTNPWGLNISPSTQVKSTALDSVNHRLFVSDSDNGRILVFNLDSNDQIVDYAADFVLCKTDFNSSVSATISASTCTDVGGLAYDSVAQRLFVTDTSHHRILVFDLSGGITNGMDAAFELGQNDDDADLDFFNDAAPTITQSGLNQPRDVSYDALNQRLFVTDGSRRVLVFDLSGGITNGMDAAFELGQNDGNSNLDFFDDSVPATTQSGMDTPSGLAYDSVNDILFVADVVNHRILVFDLSGGITNGMDAAFELGQEDDGTPFDGAASALTQSGMNAPLGVSYDEATQRFFVSDSSNNRILVFDLSGGITNGMDATDVVGQTNFTSNSSAAAQNKLSSPTGVLALEQRLLVMDGANNRVMEFSVVPPATVTPHVANDLIGQLDDDGQILFETAGANNGPNNRGFFDPDGMVVDTVHHRLFVVDSSNHRVMEFDLDVSNHLLDRVADHVFGRDTFKFKGDGLSDSRFSSPLYAAYDSVADRLFISDFANNRIVVYDTSTITDGQAAVNVIGQPTFTSNAASLTATGLDGPRGVAFDPATNRLFVGVQNQSRVMVFDVSLANLASEATGAGVATNAINVLGQSDFTTDTSNITQDGFGVANNVVLDSAGQRLFVEDSAGVRVMVFDVDPSVLVPDCGPSCDGPDAINVLGQPDFTTNTTGLSVSELDFSGFFGSGLAYDSSGQRLFVGDTGNRRVMVFDVDPSVLIPNCGLACDGPDAINVLGQANFTSNVDTLSQSSTRATAGLLYDGTTGLLYSSTADDTGQTVPDHRVIIFDAASIINGEPAVDVLGQRNPDDTPSYTSRDADNGPNIQGFNGPTDMVTDTTNHRLYVADHANRRVLVFNLDSANQFIDHDADVVLGEPDFKTNSQVTSQSRMRNPVGLALDQAGQRLFVSDNLDHRILVFDVSSLANGMDASFELGQPAGGSEFTDTTPRTTQGGMNDPQNLFYDSGSSRLFVADSSNNRVLVFDLSGGITNGMNAAFELGQPAGGTAFTSNNPATTQSGMNGPLGLGYDAGANILYVADSTNNRVLVFDTASISNGENAVHVLGQPGFFTAISGTSQSRLNAPVGLNIDETNDRLYVADQSNHRVLVYTTTSISDGMDASDVYGQSTYGGNSAGGGDIQMNQPSAIMTDAVNNIVWVADTTNNRVMVFTSVPAVPTPTPPSGGPVPPVNANPQGIVINANAVSTDSKNTLVTIRSTFSDTFVGTVDVLLSNDPNFSTYIPFHYSVENAAMGRTQWPKIVPWDLCFGVPTDSCIPGNHRVYARFYINVPKFNVIATPSP